MPEDPIPPKSTADPAQEALFERLARLEATTHFFRRLDAGHAAVHVQAGSTLVVTFERVESVLGDGEDAAMPLGHELGETFGWSFLTLLGSRQTWFRSEAVYEFFDEMIDDGLFDLYERIVFYGAGTSAHAACSFSVAAPGATVFAFSPQATLCPDYASFDRRFLAARRLDFTSRYGYAPDMLDGAGEAHVFYDPAIDDDAAHAAQFNQPHVRRHRLRYFGENPTRVLAATDSLTKIFALFDSDAELTDTAIAQVLRDRRQNRTYILRLLDHLATRERPYLAALVCHNVAERLNAPRFRNRRDALVQELAEAGITVPFRIEA